MHFLKKHVNVIMFSIIGVILFIIGLYFTKEAWHDYFLEHHDVVEAINNTTEIV